MKQLSTRISQKLLSHLAIGEQYVLQDIATLLEMDIEATKRKGVLSRTGENAIVLLINLQKSSYATPYVDHIDNDVLYWEGQLKQRFVEKNMNSGEYEIFVFVRDVIKTPFTYYGRAIPIATQYFDPGTPCKTKFSLYEYANTSAFQTIIQNPEIERPSTTFPESTYEQPAYQGPTTKRSVVEQRTVQQMYRKTALELWHNRCAVLGIEQPKILIASHIKPWRVSDTKERVDPKNALILSPLYDKLFDLGMITFKPSNGNILLSNQLKPQEYERLGLDDTKKLAMIPDGTEGYLDYHNKYVYDFAPCIETELHALIS
ncbi:hypothetical protein DSECCO2_528690 [anaerobic digester metagenome]|mgnify:CR=1 FL=1|jgi:hypothetical protein|uniref:HNH endonuclease n=1 Tax=Sphaerochaeta sp. TaxID=1972642 RepID=UPI00261D6C5C|nr:HNH endonuclease [Sphaerochaeta sp.]MDX9824177.1 HNH endonuclease [Sphaerochaeta sp.]